MQCAPRKYPRQHYERLTTYTQLLSVSSRLKRTHIFSLLLLLSRQKTVQARHFEYQDPRALVDVPLVNLTIHLTDSTLLHLPSYTPELFCFSSTAVSSASFESFVHHHHRHHHLYFCSFIALIELLCFLSLSQTDLIEPPSLSIVTILSTYIIPLSFFLFISTRPIFGSRESRILYTFYFFLLTHHQTVEFLSIILAGSPFLSSS